MMPGVFHRTKSVVMSATRPGRLRNTICGLTVRAELALYMWDWRSLKNRGGLRCAECERIELRKVAAAAIGGEE